jgi:hypothetical protein
MQVRSLIATALAATTLAAGGAAFAQAAPLGQEGGQLDAFTPTKSRADFRAELQQFRSDYPVSPWSFRYAPLASFKGAQSRADVTAAYIADRDQATAITREDSGSAALAQASSRAVRANADLASNGAAAQVR